MAKGVQVSTVLRISWRQDSDRCRFVF